MKMWEKITTWIRTNITGENNEFEDYYSPVAKEPKSLEEKFDNTLKETGIMPPPLFDDNMEVNRDSIKFFVDKAVNWVADNIINLVAAGLIVLLNWLFGILGPYPAPSSPFPKYPVSIDTMDGDTVEKLFNVRMCRNSI